MQGWPSCVRNLPEAQRKLRIRRKFVPTTYHVPQEEESSDAGPKGGADVLYDPAADHPNFDAGLALLDVGQSAKVTFIDALGNIGPLNARLQQPLIVSVTATGV